MEIVKNSASELGVKESCKAIGLSRATFYRNLEPHGIKEGTLKCPPRKLSETEEENALAIMNGERFQDQSIPEIYSTLLDEGCYLCSQRTLYRILEKHRAVRERRNQRRHPEYQKPELLATGPNQVWSWDITKLKGPQKWSYFYLYVILDIFSRYVVGWMIAQRESSFLAERLIDETCQAQGIQKNQLTLHADRGPSMKSKQVAQLLADLGITKTHSRPHVSDDNPFSEAQFKTLKYHPLFPHRFPSFEETKPFLRTFFRWYNKEHKHSGIAWMTPEMVHLENTQQVFENRKSTLQKAFENHPERFVHGKPEPAKIQNEVWINKPKLGVA